MTDQTLMERAQDARDEYQRATRAYKRAKHEGLRGADLRPLYEARGKAWDTYQTLLDQWRSTQDPHTRWWKPNDPPHPALLPSRRKTS